MPFNRWTYAVPFLFLTACGRQDPGTGIVAKPEPEFLQQGKIFETDVPYSGSRLQPEEVETFITDHHGLIADTQRFREIYSQRDYQFAWIVNDSLSGSVGPFLSQINSNDTVHQVIARLGNDLEDLAGKPEKRAAILAELEMMLTAKFMDHADHRYGSSVKEEHFKDLRWYIPIHKKDADRWRDSLVTGKMDVSSLEPAHPQYALLKEQLVRYAPLAKRPWAPIGLGPKKELSPGMRSVAIPAIRQRLQLLGDLHTPVDTLKDPQIYDKPLAQAITTFKERHGLKADPTIGTDVIDALNVPPQERLRTLLVNMERLRWMPGALKQPYLSINIPDYKLELIEQDSVAMEMAVVVGSAADRTVIFNDTITYLVLNPGWTLPESIVKNEILPELAKNQDLLEEKNMEITGGTAELPIIRQRPGDDNALGRVKFMFPNSYSIYLHDTPAKSLFGRNERALSHGCIRLSRPMDLAYYLLDGDENWPREKIEAALDSTEEVQIGLKKKLPVSITYFTAWVTDGGVLHFRNDVYGHDRQLASELFSMPAGKSEEKIAIVPETDQPSRSVTR